MAILMSCPDAMSGFNHELDDVHTPASDFGFPQVNNLMTPAPGMFPYSQTGPADLHGHWESTVEGTQNFQDFQDPTSGDAYSPPFTLGQSTPARGEEVMDDFHNKWHMSTAPEASTPGSAHGFHGPPGPHGSHGSHASEAMRRHPSRSSTSSHKQRTSSKTRRRLQATLSQAPQQRPYEMIGNAPAPTPMETSRIMDVNQYLELDALNVSPQNLFHGLPNPGFSPDALGYPVGPAMTPQQQQQQQQHVNPACTQMQLDFEPGLPGNSPTHSWDSFSSGGLARTPSPVDSEDAWMTHLASSPTDTAGSSPVFQGQSPSVSRKFRSQTQLPASELPPQVHCFVDDLSLPTAAYGLSRMEGESARDHPLYKNATTHADGLFHCPFEGTEGCTHKPEKLKCNYDKFVDSHLKPYRCKLDTCENARFSSTACLLRHEREAHGMHGHGEKPYMCRYEGCDRAQPGNGFPRHWNLKDHMKRVHNDVDAPIQPQPAGHAASPPPPSGPPPGSGSLAQAKTRKRKKDTAEPASGRKASLKSPTAAQAQTVTPAPVVKVDERRARSTQKWNDHRQKLAALASMNDFTQLADPNISQFYKEIQDHVAAMSKISTNLNSKKAPKGEYRRSFSDQTG